MSKLIVTEFMSLDGVFEAPGPDGSGCKYEGLRGKCATSVKFQHILREL